MVKATAKPAMTSKNEDDRPMATNMAAESVRRPLAAPEICDGKECFCDMALFTTKFIADALIWPQSLAGTMLDPGTLRCPYWHHGSWRGQYRAYRHPDRMFYSAAISITGFIAENSDPGRWHFI